MSDSGPFLSTDGRRRREEIAGLARAAARARRRRRIQIRTIGATVAGSLLVFAAMVEWPWPLSTPNDPSHIAINKVDRSQMPAAPQAGVHLTWIETEPNIAARLALPRQQARWRIVGDDDLLQALAEAGHPAGLVRMNGQAILLLR